MMGRILLRGTLIGALLLWIILPQQAMSPQWIASWLGLQATAAFPARNVGDGVKTDWHSDWPAIGNAAVLSGNATDTEWVWRDKFGDVRHDFANWGNWDIELIRIVADDQYLYFLVEVDDITDVNNFQLNIAMDTEIATNVNGGTSGHTWFGDDSQTDLKHAAQYSTFNISADNDGIYSYSVYTNSWEWMGNSSTYVKNWDGEDWMEVKLKWSDLGFTSVPARLRLTMASAKKGPVGDPDWPNWVDKTEEVPGSSDMLDAVSFGRYNCTDEWRDELSDGVVATSVDIAFDANGNCVNPKLPAAPTNFLAFDGTDSTWHTNGDTLWTNNPILRWDAVSPDGDAGDSIVGYYIQICTSPVVNASGFFHSDWNTAVNVNTTGSGPFNRVVYLNSDTPSNPQAWWGSADSTTGIPNGTGADDARLPILVPGNTYYIRVWARDRRGMLGDASATYVMPIDFPAWHDPYAFNPSGLTMGGQPFSATFRGNRDPKEGADVNFMVGVYDPAPRDPKDSYFINPGPAGGTAANEILNVILHIRKPGQTWAAAGKVILGNHWKDPVNGDIEWYLPSVWNASATPPANDPPDSYSYWRTDGDPDISRTWVYDYTSVNLGTGGAAGKYYLGASAGDTIEYFFEINNPFEAPGSTYLLGQVPRRFLHGYDPNGITGYRIGTYSNATERPFRFVVQKRDLAAVWHNPLSNEVPLDSGYMMRNPPWPDTSPQNVRMYVGGIGWGGWNWQMVWRNVDNGGWNVTAFNGGSVLTDTDRKLYYYNHNFNYTGGMIEYYFKMSDNSTYIFANGISDNPDTVYDNSIGQSGQETVPFKFPFTSRVRVISTASVGNDSHSMVAVLHFRSPRMEAINENAIGVQGIVNLNSCTGSVIGNVFSNAFPGAHNGRRDSHGIVEPRNLFGRSYESLLTGAVSLVSGLRKAFFGPIYPYDYGVSDSSAWNTGSDAYENVPILTYLEVFSDVIERKEAAGTVFGAAEPLEGIVYVDGDAQISNLTVTRGALIASGSITIPSTATVTATRLDLFALDGQIKIGGSVAIETGIVFSNDTIVIDTGATLRINQLGSVVAQRLSVNSGATIHVKHPPAVGFIESKESVLARATRWVISTLRESR
jgi:hypothetical protein